MPDINSTARFTDRVEYYVRYRPGYPRQVLDLMRAKMNLAARSAIADIGSGTGISSRLFLENGNSVFAVEPNAAMRAAAERALNSFAAFHSVHGTAEATNLPGSSVDFVVALQAFHWFNHAACKVEFSRVLRPGGWVMLVWNQRQTDRSPFLREYEQLILQFAGDYKTVRHENVTAEVLADFFAPYPLQTATFQNAQAFDFDGLKGRLLSSSYVPNETHERFPAMIDFLQDLFTRHAVNGRVELEYDTQVFYGVRG